MKYNIYINQRAVIDNWINLDIIDLAIFDYIKDFSKAKKVTKIIIEWEEYFWIQYEHFIKNMPLLWINNKNSLKKRIDNLIREGILEKKILHWNSTYFKFWNKYDLLIWSEEVHLKVEGGSTEKEKGVIPKSRSINNTINNTNNKNNNITTAVDKKSSIEKIYKTYKDWVELDSKYLYPAWAKLYIEQLLNEYTEAQLISSIDNYFAETDKKWRKSPKYFFSNSKRSDNYRIFEWFIKDTKPIKKIDFADLFF